MNITNIVSLKGFLRVLERKNHKHHLLLLPLLLISQVNPNALTLPFGIQQAVERLLATVAMVTNYVTHDFGCHGPCDVRDRVKQCRKPRIAVTMDTGGGRGGV